MGTPTDALEPAEDSAERLAALDHRLDLAETSGREASEAVRAALEQVAQELAKLRALLAALSEEV